MRKEIQQQEVVHINNRSEVYVRRKDYVLRRRLMGAGEATTPS